MIEMNCHEFELRFHEILDDRTDPRSNPRLMEHASHCEQCSAMLQTQQRILSVFPAKPRCRPRGATFMVAAAFVGSIAALVAVAVFSGVNEPREETTVASTTATDSDRPALPESAIKNRQDPDAERNEFSVASSFASHWNIDDFFATDFRSQTEWIEPVTIPIRPLTDSVSSTLNVLWRTLPGRQTKKPTDDGKTSYQIRQLGELT